MTKGTVRKVTITFGNESEEKLHVMEVRENSGFIPCYCDSAQQLESMVADFISHDFEELPAIERSRKFNP